MVELRIFRSRADSLIWVKRTLDVASSHYDFTELGLRTVHRF
jgi:hypothetical protein